MKNIIFTSVPFKARKLFKVKLKHSPSLDIPTADQCVRTCAGTLKPEEVDKISFRLIGNNKAVLLECDADVRSSDQQDGLVGILGRILLENQDSEVLSAKIAIEDALDTGQKETDSVDDVEGDRFEQSKPKKKETEVLSSQDLWNSQENEEKDNDKDNEESTSALTAPAVNENIPFPIADFKEDSDQEKYKTKTSENVEESTQVIEKISEQENTNSISKQAQMIPLSEYLDLADIDKKLEKFGSEDFDVSKVLDDLGYVENPTSEYERQLNDVILTELAENDLSNTQISYENDQIEVKQKLKTGLITAYNKETEQSITESVENDVEEKISQLESYAQADQDQNNDHAGLEEDNFKSRQKERREIEIRQFKEKLEKKDAIDFSSYSEKIRKETRDRNQAIQRSLAVEKETVRKNSRNDLIEKRNDSLLDQKVELSSKTEEKIITLYRQHREDFHHKLRIIRSKVSAQNKRIDDERKVNERIAWDKKIKQQTLKEQRRKNDLLEQQNRLKARENKYNDKSFKAIMKMMYKVQNPSQNQKMSNISAKKSESVNSGVEKEAPATADNVQHHLDEKKQGTDKTTNKSWKKSKIIGAILLLGGFIAAVLLGFYTLATPAPQPQSSTPTSKTETKSKKKEKASASSSLKKTDKMPQKKQVAKKTHKSNNNLDKYISAKTWAQKVDILNGALGQHDDRALKQINANYSTNISKLYENIVLKNNEGTRQVWNRMLPSERNEISRGARDSVVLAFYAVKDWQTAWEVSEAIHG